MSGCSNTDDFSLFGYTTHSQYNRNIRTVYVPIFKNKTFVRGIEFQLTEAVQKQIEAKTPWKVSNDCHAADSELIGTVVAMPKRVIFHNLLNEAREAEITLAAQVVWRDLKNDQVLSSATGPLPDSSETPPMLDELGPPRIVARPMIVQRSAAFIPELGETVTSAKKKAVDDLAEQIVSMMETPW